MGRWSLSWTEQRTYQIGSPWESKIHIVLRDWGKRQKKPRLIKEGGKLPNGEQDPHVQFAYASTDIVRDQELRFTVHESPDYYQLKVSVFNDDRKTELIGETWVSLEPIIVPGGGKQDQWHHLNCKGRFAGEIRIELTYYDTRPKEPILEGRRQSSTVNGLEDSHRETSSSVGGPRQPKPIKRRPLPSDPTILDTSRSSPQPLTPSTSAQHISDLQQEQQAPSPSARLGNTSPIDKRYYSLEQDPYRSSPPNMNGYGASDHAPRNHHEYVASLDESGYGRMDGQNIGYNTPIQDRQEPRQNPFPCDASVYDGPSQNHQPQDQSVAGYSTPPSYEERYERPYTQSSQDAYKLPAGISSSLPQHVSMPEFGMRSEQHNYGQQHQHRASLPQQGGYNQNNIAHDSFDDPYGSILQSNQEIENEAPPPPPVHRSGGLQSPKRNEKSHADSYPPVSGPAPLNIRHTRNSISASPLSQIHNSSSHPEYEHSSSPVRNLPQPYTPRSPQHSHNNSERRHSPEHFPVSPSREYSQPTPPSLVPGYDPRIAEDESERLIRESHSRYRQNSEPAPQYQAFATQRSPNAAQPIPRNDVPLQLRMLGNGQETRPHRSSAPVIPRREVSPEIRTPIRKSVSPQPGPVSGERRQSAIPFGPDSYDAFNPSLSDAASINSAGPKYNTPEQAREAQYEREKEAKLAEGPIIGSDGREIDPSDHLPADTWAPEPESKAPKKKPEITVRFRRSPAGAQPMPASSRKSTEPIMRPNPMVTPAYAHSSDAISPTSAARTRLQKKTRVAIAQPMSSPVVPTVNTNVRGAMPRAASEHPLREPENYAYGSNPAYPRVSQGGFPPPVPGKVPLSAGTGGEDWGTSALSEEMRRIDIGVGPGQARARRNRYDVSAAGRY